MQAVTNTTRASGLRRLAAFGIDWLVLSAYMTAMGLVTWGATAALDVNPFDGDGSPWANHALGFLTLTLPAILYFALTEASNRRATLGKRALGIRVASVDGERLTLRQAAVRAVARFVPWEAAHAVLWRIDGWPIDPAPLSALQWGVITGVWVAVGVYVASLFVGRGRTPYDIAAGAWVVLGRPTAG